MPKVSFHFTHSEPAEPTVRWDQPPERVVVCSRTAGDCLADQAGRCQPGEAESPMLSARHPAPPQGISQNPLAAALAVLLVLTTGCSRAFYRHQADREVRALVARAARETSSSLGEFTIQPAYESRMFDPSPPDLPPMPPDDPTSHRLMHCVDCKPGWPCWHCYGNTPHVENPDWQAYLPCNEEGEVVLNREEAVEMALRQSPDYQRALEDLYLSALDVTFERFRFDAQFFGGNSTFFTADGPARAGAAQGLLRTDTDLQMRKLLATGGELVVGAANSLVWQFAGPDTYGANTLLDFSLAQPLLRAGGRAVVLESLTDSERALLANIRQMERFRRGFYAQVVTGRSPGQGPARGGVGIGAVSAGVAGAGGFFGLLEQQLRIRNQLANVSGLRESLQWLEALHEAGRISGYDVGLTRQNLYQAQSTLLSQEVDYQSRLDGYKITLGLAPQLDMKIEDPLLARFELIDKELSDTRDEVTLFLDHLRDQAEVGRIELTGENLQRLQGIRDAAVAQVAVVQRDFESLLNVLPTRGKRLRQLSGRGEFHRGDVDPRVIAAEEMYLHAMEISLDLYGVEPSLPLSEQLIELCLDLYDAERAANLAERLVGLSEKLYGKDDAEKVAQQLIGRWRELFGIEPSDQLARRLKAVLEEAKQPEEVEEYKPLGEQLETAWIEVEQFRQKVTEADPGDAAVAAALHQQLIDLVDGLSRRLLALSMIQAKARLDAIMLEPIELTAEKALDVARQNRRDWMNARAALVDVWRQIEVRADDLQSGLDVTFSGDLSTTDNNPVRFRATTGRLRVGLEFDAPLTRLAERNAYRETLINYQRARRAYYAYEDGITESLRATIRTIRLNQLNFEVQRARVFLAIDQVNRARLGLEEPPRGMGASQLGVNAARNLVLALSDLLNTQNNFLRIWVNQEALRLNLDLDLGTMQLDGRGMWIDPGPMGERDADRAEDVQQLEPPEQPEQPDQLEPAEQPEQIPTPEGVPLLEPPELP